MFEVSKVIPQPLPRPLFRTPPCPSNIYTEARGSTRLAVTVKYGLQLSQYSPAIAASVMGCSETLFIATATVLVILAATIQPGEHYLPNRKHLHMYIYKLWLVSMQQRKRKKCLQTKRISWLPPNFFFLFFCACPTL